MRSKVTPLAESPGPDLDDPRRERWVAARIHFGVELRRSRNALELSQEKLAEIAGIHRTYVAQVEAGSRNLALENLLKLAEAVQRPLSDMLKPY